MAEKRMIDANGSYTINASDNTGYGLCFGGGIISVMDKFGHCVCEFFAEDAPAADVVEVVRCKDCILYEPKYLAGLQKNDNYGICTRYKFLTEEYSLRFETDFCSFGARKEQDHG
ncbi:MAG: hypothetical protein IJF49_08370 [Clostridia bacterium]|nr:hypothetical protein [Clostridia bacterium]